VAELSRRGFLAATGGVIALGASGVVAACSSAREQSRIDVIRSRGRIRVGIADEAPYGYLDAAGRATGAFPEIVRAAMIGLAVDLEAIVLPFDTLVDTLVGGRIDVIGAGMTITPERCARVRFGRPEIISYEALGVPPGNPDVLSDLASVAAHPTARLGVLAGAIEEGDALSAGVPITRLVTFPRAGELVTNLVAGTIDAFVLTTRSVESLRADAAPGAFDVTEPFVPMQDGEPVHRLAALATPSDDAQFAMDLDDLIEPLRRDGTIAGILAGFGWTPREVLPAGQPFGCS
jgi:polar amino acid transport system substrate-binding protein